jgi:hypothetical protein
MSEDTLIHGRSTYVNHGCRCSACRRAHTRGCRAEYERRAKREPPEHVHGTPNGYGNWGCRCAQCTEANRVAKLNRRRRVASTEVKP